MHRLRSLVEQRGRNSWEIGDLLVTIFGRPSAAGRVDGSRAKLAVLADELGLSLSWLTAARIASAAWPVKHRRLSVAWPVHRALSARPERFALLAGFVASCDKASVTPSVERLRVWLDEHDRQAGPVAGVRPVAGRPRRDPVERLVGQAMAALGRADLERLVAMLRAEIDALGAAA